MTGYHVQLVDGPAKGFSYVTFVEPEEEIVMADFPYRPGLAAWGWCHVLPSEQPWPGECRYRRGEIDAADAAAKNDFGEVVVPYEVKLNPNPNASLTEVL